MNTESKEAPPCAHEPEYEDFFAGCHASCKHCHKEWTKEMMKEWEDRMKGK